MSVSSKYRLLLPNTANLSNDEWLHALLKQRGIEKEVDVQAFLTPDYDEHRHDPWLLHDMEAAVDRILLAIANQEKIVVYSDYDCDGIPGGVVLHDFFKAIGYENFQNYIPHRHFEGFGLNEAAITKLSEADTSLIITVDCGVGDTEAVTIANEKGVDVIITDHHEPGETLPPAVAVVNPKVGDSYPFKELCGAAVAFKLVEALLLRGDFDLKPGQEKWWLDMVGLATLSDMVPLIGENRVLAHYGLQVLRKSRRPGLQHLFRTNRVKQNELNEDDVGFTIAPRVNAASRMDNPEDAFFLLATNDEAEAGARAAHLEKLNNERKGVVAAMTKDIKKRLDKLAELPDVLVLGDPAWRPALVGLSANSLASTYHRPVFLWGRDGHGTIKGSCRSDGLVSVFELMQATADSFIEYGGHHASGGFSVKEESIFHLTKVLNQALSNLGETAKLPKAVAVDAELTFADVNQELLQNLRHLSPFGVGNEKPLFAFKAITPLKVEQFGKTKEHLKLLFKNGDSWLEAITFFATPDSFTTTPVPNEALTLLAHVEESNFMNRRQVRLRIVDILE